MTYRNIPRLVLAVASVLLIGGAIVALGAIVGQDPWGQTGSAPLWAYFVIGIVSMAGILAGVGWLVLHGVNYDTWYRSTHPGQPLHAVRPEELTSFADWRAADRTPSA
jgi:hypothetical protein